MLVKNIVWRDGEGDIMAKKDDQGRTFANIHILVGYNGATIKDFKDMADEMRKTFPFIKDEEVECGKVIQSDRFKRFSIIGWNGYVEKKDYPGWNTFTPDYYW